MAIPKDDLIDAHVSTKNTRDAIAAILKHTAKEHELEEETEMLGANERRICLSIGKKKIKDIVQPDPRVIPLAHPIVDPRKTSICLIVKDPQREYKDLLEREKIKFIGRVVGVSKLKGKFRGFEERRQLLTAHGLFLVDDRVAALMPKLLGSTWFKAKKQPLPVNMGAKDLKSHLERAVNNTFMNENKGHTVTVKIGHTLQSSKHVFENVCTALPEILKHVDGGWDNVQNVYLSVPGVANKAGVSLPLWTCDLGIGPGARWDGSLTKQPADEWCGFGAEEGGIVEESSELPAAQPRPSKGKKRSVGEQLDESDDDSAPAKKRTTKVSSLSTSKSANSQIASSSTKPIVKASRDPSPPSTNTKNSPDKLVPPKTQHKEQALRSTTTMERKKQKVVDGKVGKRSPKEQILGPTRKSLKKKA